MDGFPVFITKARSKRRLNVAKEVATINRLRLNFERTLTGKLIRLFERTGRRAARDYKRGAQFGALAGDLERQLLDVMRPHYREVISLFAGRMFDGYKLEPRFEQLLDKYLLLFAAQRIKGITNTTRNIIRGAIFAGEAEALGVGAIADLIVERTGGAMGRSRAATIARTETHGAASYAQYEAAEQMPLTFLKEWNSVGDSRTRPHHAAMNGVQVGEGEDFIVRVNGQEYRMAHTHDPRGGAVNNINCRCVTLYIADEDEIFRD